MSQIQAKVAFVFSTKDRVDFTLRSLRSIDTEEKFDLIWIDGSDTQEGKMLPRTFQFRRCRLVESYFLTGGPDKAIRFGLERLLSLGYDFCGLIENDVVLDAGWYGRLMKLFSDAQAQGYAVGAATVRNVESRVLFYRSGFTVNWVVGAGMVLFTRQAAKIILVTYGPITSGKLGQYFSKRFSLDLKDRWELWMDRDDRPLGCDWSYAMRLFEHGLVSVGSIPSMARNLDMDMEKDLKTAFVAGGEPILALRIPRVALGARIRLVLCDDSLPVQFFLLLKTFRGMQINLWAFARRCGRLIRYLGQQILSLVPKPGS